VRAWIQLAGQPDTRMRLTNTKDFIEFCVRRMHMSRCQVSRACGINHAAVYRWDSGKYGCTLKTFIRFLEFVPEQVEIGNDRL